MTEPIYQHISFGDTVTIVTAHNQQQRGKAVMRGPHGWVCNAGGRHGTPMIATPSNTIKVKKKRK